MHDFYYFYYLGCLFIHLNIIIQVSQLSSIFLNLSTTMLTSAFKPYIVLALESSSISATNYPFALWMIPIMFGEIVTMLVWEKHENLYFPLTTPVPHPPPWGNHGHCQEVLFNILHLQVNIKILTNNIIWLYCFWSWGRGIYGPWFGSIDSTTIYWNTVIYKFSNLHELYDGYSCPWVLCLFCSHRSMGFRATNVWKSEMP